MWAVAVILLSWVCALLDVEHDRDGGLCFGNIGDILVHVELTLTLIHPTDTR